MDSSDIREALESVMGKEGLEEADENFDFLSQKFCNEIINSHLAILTGVMMSDGEPSLETLLAAAFMNGLTAYRDFMQENGVDVWKIEGRE